MKSSGKFLLSKEVHVDEFTVGGPEIGAVGRSDCSKNIVILGVEIRPKGKMGLAYGECVEDYSEKSFKPFFEDRIDKEADIQTDGFATYRSIKKDYKNLEQFYSEKGKSFPELHVLIMNFKAWLRGIHHKCQYGYLQKYLDEFFYRFNRRSHKNGIFHNLINRFIEESPCTINELRELST